MLIYPEINEVNAEHITTCAQLSHLITLSCSEPLTLLSLLGRSRVRMNGDVTLWEGSHQAQFTAQGFDILPQRADVHVLTALQFGNGGLSGTERSSHFRLSLLAGLPQFGQLHLYQQGFRLCSGAGLGFGGHL